MSTSRRLVVLSRRRRRSQAHRLGHHWDHWGTMEQKSQGRKSHTPPKGRYLPAWTTAQLPRDAGHHRTGAPNSATGLEAPNQGKRACRCSLCTKYCTVPCALSACRGTPTPHRGGRTLVAGRAQRREEHQSQHQCFQVPLETGFKPKGSCGFPSSVPPFGQTQTGM